MDNTVESKDDEAEEENAYEKFIIQSSLILEFNGSAFAANEVVLSASDSVKYLKESLDFPLVIPK